jgi:hypothetical protein
MAIPFWSNSNFWRSWNTKRLIGLRYYSEDTIDGKKIQSYVIFEKIVNGGGVSIADATPAQIFGDSGYKELAFNVIKVHIVDGVKTIKGEYNLYDTNKLRETFRVSDEITINVIN